MQDSSNFKILPLPALMVREGNQEATDCRRERERRRGRHQQVHRLRHRRDHRDRRRRQVRAARIRAFEAGGFDVVTDGGVAFVAGKLVEAVVGMKFPGELYATMGVVNTTGSSMVIL